MFTVMMQSPPDMRKLFTAMRFCDTQTTMEIS